MVIHEQCETYGDRIGRATRGMSKDSKGTYGFMGEEKGTKSIKEHV